MATTRIHDRRRVTRGGGDPFSREDAPILVDDGTGDLGATDVDPDRMHGVRV